MKISCIDLDYGWDIDIPCSICGKDNCPGSVCSFIPNRIGNVKDGLDSKEEAIKEALILLESHKVLCVSMENAQNG